jgi:long-subunit fatty acid transport protein
MSATRVGLLTVLFVVFAVPCALGDGVIRDGLGALSIGRGGTNIASADNGEILLDNPAGMANVEGSGLVDLGVDVLFTDLQYSNPQNPTANAWHDPFPIPEASVIWKSGDGQWAFGLGVFAPAGFAANWNLEGPPALPGVHDYKSLGMMAKFLPGVAYRVNDRLSVGGTLGLGLAHTELQGPYFLQSPGPFQGTPTIMRLFTTGVALSWSVGLQYQLTEATTIGATFQSATRYSQTGGANMDIPVLGSSGFGARLDMTWPETVGLGIRQELSPNSVFSADVIYFNWSSAFDHFDVNFTHPTNPLFAALLGPSFGDQFPLDWRDSVSMRLGFEQRLGGNRVLRAGYAYHDNQIPARTLTPYIPATLEHAFSLGYGYRWQDWDLNLAYQYSFGPAQTVVQSGLVGGDFNNSWERDQAHWASLSVIRRF